MCVYVYIYIYIYIYVYEIKTLFHFGYVLLFLKIKMTTCQLKHVAVQREYVQPDDIHEVPVVLHYNIWRESHQTYATPTSVA